MHVGLAAIPPEEPAGITQIASPKHEPANQVQEVKASVPEPVSPFEKLEAVIVPEEEPAELPTPEYGHGKKYEWLVGRLQRVHSPKHEWKIRYAALDEHDEWGGSMVLAQDARMDEWQDDDLVYVEGEILNERPSVYLAGPLYRIRVIRPANDVSHLMPRSR
jgi:hypothetical protein